MKKKTNTPSVESQQEALKIAKATQKPAQTKEQTKLIATTDDRRKATRTL